MGRLTPTSDSQAVPTPGAEVGPVAVWGLGYVGMTTARELLEGGVDVIGIDPSTARIDELRQGQIRLHRSIPSLALDFRQFITSERMTLATDPLPAVAGIQYHFVCVPTERAGMPFEGALALVLDTIRGASPASLVVIESTVAPTWLDRPYFEGLRVCLAPRRDWFHAHDHNIRTLTRVLAGTDAETTRAGKALVEKVSNDVVTSRNPRAVAFTKAYENSLWFLMAVYTNYLIREFAHIDMREVLRLAKTNWRTPFDLYPGFRIGGYCLPLSIEYIAEAHRGGDFGLAAIMRDLNDSYVDQLVSRIRDAGARDVLVLGLCYRPDVRVHTNSAGFTLATRLLAEGIECCVHDPLYAPEEVREITGAEPAPFPDGLAEADAIVICTPQREYLEFDAASFFAERVHRRVVIFDAPSIWMSLLGARSGGDEQIRYHALGHPSWLNPTFEEVSSP